MTNKTNDKFTLKMCERAVRMVFNHERDHPHHFVADVDAALEQKVLLVPQ